MASNNGQQSKALPKDGNVVVSILKDMGITEFEPQVVTQLLEFAYRYLTTNLDDAKVYAQHAGKKMIDTEDVQLAISLYLDKTFTSPPPRDLLMEVARGKNSTPLPQIKPHCGIRLPPDRYCMTACNYQIRSNKKPNPAQMKVGPTAFQGGAMAKPPIKRATIPTVARTQSLTPTPKPVIKFSSAPSAGVVNNNSPAMMMEVDEPPANYLKRKHPDDD